MFNGEVAYKTCKQMDKCSVLQEFDFLLSFNIFFYVPQNLLIGVLID